MHTLHPIFPVNEGPPTSHTRCNFLTWFAGTIAAASAVFCQRSGKAGCHDDKDDCEQTHDVVAFYLALEGWSQQYRKKSNAVRVAAITETRMPPWQIQAGSSWQ